MYCGSVPACQTGRPPRDRRTIVNAILWILKTGSPWRDLPKEYQPWSTVWDLFDEWNDNGLLDAILQRLRAIRVDCGDIKEDLWCIDAPLSALHGVREAVEKKRPGGTCRSRVRPITRRFFHENPFALRWRWSSTLFPPYSRRTA